MIPKNAFSINKPQRDNSLSFLNIIRIICAFGIFLIHFKPKVSEISGTGLIDFFTSKILPVEFFFVISGLMFIVAYYPKMMNNQLSNKKFILNRIIRFYPLMITTVFLNYIGLVGMHFINGIAIPSALELFVSMFFGASVIFTGKLGDQLNGPAWYLGVIMLCYLVCLLIVYINKKTKCRYFFLIPVVCAVPILIIAPNFPFINFHVARGFFCFFLGTALGLFLTKFTLLKNKYQISIRVVCFVMIITYFVLRYTINKFYIPMEILFPVMVASPIIIAFYKLDKVNKVFAIKPFSYLAKISFDFYIWHWLVASAFGCLSFSGYWVLLFIAIIVALIVAAISNIVFGKYLTGYLYKLTSKIK